MQQYDGTVNGSWRKPERPKGASVTRHVHFAASPALRVRTAKGSNPPANTGSAGMKQGSSQQETSKRENSCIVATVVEQLPVLPYDVLVKLSASVADELKARQTAGHHAVGVNQRGRALKALPSDLRARIRQETQRALDLVRRRLTILCGGCVARGGGRRDFNLKGIAIKIKDLMTDKFYRADAYAAMICLLDIGFAHISEAVMFMLISIKNGDWHGGRMVRLAENPFYRCVRDMSRDVFFQQAIRDIGRWEHLMGLLDPSSLTSVLARDLRSKNVTIPEVRQAAQQFHDDIAVIWSDTIGIMQSIKPIVQTEHSSPALVDQATPVPSSSAGVRSPTTSETSGGTAGSTRKRIHDLTIMDMSEHEDIPSWVDLIAEEEACRRLPESGEPMAKQPKDSPREG